MIFEDDTKAAFLALPPSKREFVLDYIRFMEGSWGDLYDYEARAWHYRVLENCLGFPGGSVFSDLMRRDMEARWKEMSDAPATSEFLVGMDRYHRNMVLAESAFRDFHYQVEDWVKGAEPK